MKKYSQRAQVAFVSETYPLPQQGSLASIFFTWAAWDCWSPAHFSSSSSEAAWPSTERNSWSSAREINSRSAPKQPPWCAAAVLIETRETQKAPGEVLNSPVKHHLWKGGSESRAG